MGRLGLSQAMTHIEGDRQDSQDGNTEVLYDRMFASTVLDFS